MRAEDASACAVTGSMIAALPAPGAASVVFQGLLSPWAFKVLGVAKAFVSGVRENLFSQGAIHLRYTLRASQ